MKTSQSGEVVYQLEIVNPDGTSVLLPKRKNLILDQGLDQLATGEWKSFIASAAVGTGTTPTKRDSGAVTFSRAGNVVTASAGFFTAADVGRLLKFDSGQEVRINSFTNATTVTTTDAGTIAAAEGTIWYVNQVGLVTETKRVGNDQATEAWSSPTWTYTRRYTFAQEVATVTYWEIGWSFNGAAGNNLFGRDMFGGAGVTLVAGQQLRVTMQLQVTIDLTERAWTNIITGGWGSDGTCKIEGNRLDTGPLSGVGAGFFLLSANAAALSFATGNGVSISGGHVEVVASLDAYVAGSFKRRRTGVIPVGTTVANVRSIAFGIGSASSQSRVLMNAAHTKADTYRLTVVHETTWGRTLSNL